MMNHFIERILYFLSGLPRDKKDHMLFGLIIYNFVALVSFDAAIIVVLLTAVLKEVYDFFNPTKHSCDYEDVIATIAFPIVLYVLQHINF
jgi:hypothetical protein